MLLLGMIVLGLATFWALFRFNRRAANVPYFSGPGGITPPGGNTGPPGSLVPGLTPDLTKTESRITSAVLVKH